jgi:hypothetical protein
LFFAVGGGDRDAAASRGLPPSVQEDYGFPLRRLLFRGFAAASLKRSLEEK